MNCRICDSEDTRLLSSDIGGYLPGIKYSVYECNVCSAQFIPADQIDTSIYEKIYSTADHPGYDRYFQYAKDIRGAKDKLKYIQSREPSYFPACNYLKDKKQLYILDVGCGYGYLTYALNEYGHYTLGIDLSKTSTEFARVNFGNCYKNISIEEFTAHQKFDVIVATELIEHLVDPIKFIRQCKELLTENGKIIISTPNKDYFAGQIWNTDAPPVHTVWFNKKSFEIIAKKEGMTCEFTDFSNYYCATQNRLVMAQMHKVESGAVGQGPATSNPINIKGPLKQFIKKIVLFGPINKLSFSIYKFLNKKKTEDYILGVILTKGEIDAA